MHSYLFQARIFITGYGHDTKIPCATVGSCMLTDIHTGKQVAGVDVAQIFFDQNISRQKAAKLGLIDKISKPTGTEVCDASYIVYPIPHTICLHDSVSAIPLPALHLTHNLIRTVQASSVATCTFGEVSERLATQLIEQGDVFYCAGALMVEHELVNPFVRIDGTIQSVMGLSPELLASLWDKINLTTESPRKRKLESSSGSEPKPKLKATNASADTPVTDGHDIGVDDGDSDEFRKHPTY